MFDNDIEDSHPNKQYWMDELRANVFRCFDVSEPDWAKQNPTTLDTVWGMMEADWEYVGGVILMKKFASHCQTLLKRERHKLHNYWRNVCNRDRSKPGPVTLDPLKWARLVDHFDSPALITQSAIMSARRAEVTHKENFGRGGAVGAAKRLVRIFILFVGQFSKL